MYGVPDERRGSTRQLEPERLKGRERGIGDRTAGLFPRRSVDATTRAAHDLGYKTTTVHDACATLDLEFADVSIPAAQVHATIMAALAFAYGSVVSTDELIG